MLKFPAISPSEELPAPRIESVREYAVFSELCLRSNSKITPENCMDYRADERDMRRPFSLVHDPKR
jgi:hypothetical protein